MSPLDLFAIPGFTDPFSSLSHLLGAAVFAGLARPLVHRGVRANGAAGMKSLNGRTVSLAIFAVAAVFLLTMSGVFHLLGPEGSARPILRRLDHAAIFVLIAGTFTPIHTILFRGAWRWGMLAFVWTLAALGVTLKSIFFDSTPQALGLGLYIGMGWTGLASMGALWKRMGPRGLAPLLGGGIAYTLGAAIEGIEPRPLVAGVIRAHEIFHVAVLAGLGLHWWFVWRIADYALPRLPGELREVKPLGAGTRPTESPEVRVFSRDGNAAAMPSSRE